MVKSMTGFGSSVCENENYTIKAEIRTLNSKTFDFKAKIPQKYFVKEIEIQAMIENVVGRGKTDLQLQIKYNDPIRNIKNINKEIADAYFNEISQLFDKWGQPKEQAARIVFTFPDIFTNELTENGIDEPEWTNVVNCISSALESLDEYRKTEGQKLEIQFKEHISKLTELKNLISLKGPSRIEKINEKLRQKIAEGGLNPQNDRFEQELIYYIEKLDITEELDRLDAHLSYFLEVMNQEENSGRKLSFITQEIGREINTIGSKANDHEIQRIIVEMKEELEKIKQQLANIL